MNSAGTIIPSVRLIPRLLLMTILTSVSICCFNGCSNNNTGKKRIVIGVQNDVQTINPMYAFSVMEGNLIDLLFLKPAKEIWNDSLGIIEFAPLLAEKWDWKSDSSSITLYLRDDVYWSDGKPVTARDIVFSFDIYSNPEADTRFSGQFNNFYTTENSGIDIEKTFKVISPAILTIYFKKDVLPSLLDINLEILPAHVWSKYSPGETAGAKENFEPVTSGPYKLKKWEKGSAIILHTDSSSFLFISGRADEIIFKIIPDYKARITQLKNGEIDLTDNIKSEDAAGLQKMEKLKIVPLRGRDYDYIGWNHVNPQNPLIPNKFFSSARVRKALTYAVNREEILYSFLGNYGEICKGPVSPMFKSYLEKNIQADAYNPAKVKAILKEEGWIDSDNDGIREKNNIEFKFDLYINSGNPRREYAATIIKNNLKAAGVAVDVQVLETGTFIDGLRKGKFDAWIAGWTIPVPLDLNPYWHSDNGTGFLNFSSYHNTEVDSLLSRLNEKIPESEKTDIYKKIQYIFYNDEPVTFLYWFDNIVACNKKLDKVNFSLLGLVKNAWDWEIY